MSTIVFGRKRISFLDLSEPKPRGRKQSPRMKALSDLKPGDKTILDHSDFKTNFSAWIAQARARTGQALHYRPLGRDRYEVSLPDGG